MQPFTCPICDSHAYKKAIPYLAKSIAFLNKKLVRCSQCKASIIYPYPEPDELTAYYNQSYWTPTIIETRRRDLKEQGQSRYDFFCHYLSKDFPLKVLDVGSAVGLIQEIFNEHFERVGLVYHAVEINPAAVDSLKKTIGQTNIFSKLDNTNEDYSIIIISHLLEHFQNPLALLKEAAMRLNKKGLLFIEVPNEDFRWKSRNEPHMVFFNPANLCRLVNKADYEILKVNTCGPLLYNMAGYKANIWEIIKRYGMVGIKRSQSFYRGRSISSLGMKAYNEYGGNRRWIRLIAQKNVVLEFNHKNVSIFRKLKDFIVSIMTWRTHE